MKRLAVNFALLPTKDSTQTLITFNRKLSADPQKIYLDSSNCYPHISLAMGVMSEEVYAGISGDLGRIGKRLIPAACTASGITELHIPTGEHVSALDIKPSPELLQIHLAAMEIAQRYCTVDADLGTLHPDPPPEEISLHWINSYHKESAYAAFWPHITLGTGKFREAEIPIPIDIEIDSLALCHLGNYCTCRDVLIRFSR
jgi:hypothetical protein